MANAIATAPQAELSRNEISDQLGRVLASTAFHNCQILQAFLRYITSRALESDNVSISEQSIAIGVFARDTSFDSATDTIVRTQAYRLRQKLREYYAGQGAEDLILIEVPKGHYRPIFSLRASPVSCPSPETVHARAPAVEPSKISRSVFVLAAAVTGLSILAVGIWIGKSSAVTAQLESGFNVGVPQVNRFWSSFLGEEKHPIVAYSNDLYLMTDRGDLLSFSGQGADRGTIADSAITRKNILTDGSQSRLGPLFYEDDKSDVGEVVGAVALAETLTRINVQPVFKRGRVITTYDLESHDIIFLGSPFVNKILNQVDSQADFRFEGETDSQSVWGDSIRNIRPRAGEARDYHLERDPKSGAILTDYAVVSCFPSLTSGRKILILGGITTSGTQAAAQFVTSADGIQTMDKVLAQNHSSSYKFGSPLFQFLLRVNLDHGLDVLHTECIASRTQGT